MLQVRGCVAAFISFYLVHSGLKKNSLSKSGSLAAFVVGFVSMSSSYRFGLILLLFYYSSTKLTKYKLEQKSKLEEGFTISAARDWKQVFASSLLAIVVAASHFLIIGDDMNVDFASGSTYMDIFYIMDGSLSHRRLSAVLQVMYVAHFATANADTWASEVGMLAKNKPRLITSFFMREVPAGTNGGVSVLGTVASAAGGAFIGFVYYALTFLYPASITPQYPMIIVGLICGIIGSLIDSFLGATVQATYYSQKKQQIIKHYNSESSSKKDDDDVIRVCGMDILSNEAVNFLSIGITMIIGAIVAPVVFQAFE